MADTITSKRRVTPATIALVAAALLAVVAIGIAIFRSNDTAESAGNSAAPGNSAEAAPTMDQAIAALREQVRQNPDNDQGWYMLGLAQRDNGQFAEAAASFRRAMELRPDNADYPAYLGEMLLVQSNGQVPPEAERLFRRVLELQPDNPQARYYLATLKDMRGDHRGAVDDLIALVRAAPADAPWEAQVRQAAVTIARTNNINIEGRLPPPRQPQQSTATAAIPGPTREQMDAARAIPPGEQDEMVQGMVNRLAERLRQNPRDEARWIMLMRSRMVLNDRTGATDALRQSLAAFQNDAAAQGRLREAARQLGVPNPA